MIKLTKPGLYSDIPMDDYHGDLTEGPSLSASGCNDLAGPMGCPAKYWLNSYLNPRREPEEFSKDAAMGTATHVAMLEPDLWSEKVVVLEYDDYRKKDAQADRDDALARGLTPILIEQADAIQEMRRVVMAHGVARAAFTEGKPEQTIVWKDGVWWKTRLDWLKDHHKFAIDYKTVPCAHPDAFERHAFEQGMHVQAALQCFSISTINDGHMPLEYWYVAQERKPPYLVSVCKLDQQAIEWGMRFVIRAKQIFMACLERNEWPGYRHPEHPFQDRAFEISLPSYAPFKLQDMDEKGLFKPLPKPDDKLLRRALDWQAPTGEIV